MLDKTGIIRRLAMADARAQAELAPWTELDGADPTAFAESIHRYVLAKFLLDDEDEVPLTHDLNELAKLSVAKATRLNPNELTLLDVSRHCGATSSFMTKKSRKAAEELLEPYFETAAKAKDIPAIFYMFTDIRSQSTELLYWGFNADRMLARAFDCNPKDGRVTLPGVVSRKKQVIPAIMSTLQTLMEEMED